ncbi:MAG: hypothetical protein K2O55_01810 [Alistipes sp.]|nr:hypothetical protein [Alistipes sp.]
MNYFLRSLKYFAALCILCIVLMALMLATGTSALSARDTVYVMFRTTRYLTMLGAIVVLAALYPRFGFVVRRIEGSTEHHRQQIVHAFKSAGFSLVCEADGRMIFRAESFLLRLLLLFEDRIAVRQDGEHIVLDGIRRGVARVEYRLDSYIRMTARNE